MHFVGVLCCRQEGNIVTIATSVFFKLPYTLSLHEASQIKKTLAVTSYLLDVAVVCL